MSADELTIADYPLAEMRPDLVRGQRGKGLAEVTLEAVLAGQVVLDDLRITGTALRQQADIARAAGRPTLAANFERAAELVDVPQETIMRIYELLRPGRAASKHELNAVADALNVQYGAGTLADFIREAAEVYERRGLFNRRY